MVEYLPKPELGFAVVIDKQDGITVTHKIPYSEFEELLKGPKEIKFADVVSPMKTQTRPKSTEGWGDKVESALKSMGIDEDLYVSIKEKFGLPPKCGCKKRKEWLNRVGEAFGKIGS